MTVIASIVEGYGEVISIPILLRRIDSTISAARPIRIKRQQIVKEDVLERYLRIAVATLQDRGGRGGVLLVLDADDDCPARLGPELTVRGRCFLGKVPFEVVLAKREFETWLIGGRAVSAASPAPCIEEIRNPKTAVIQALGRYSETVDQPRLTERMDLQAASESCPSFDKLQRAIKTLASA